MLDILIKALSYVAIILLGFVLRRIGFFDEHAFPVLSKLVIRVTLPAALISGAVGRQIDPYNLMGYMQILLLGFGCGVVYMACGYLMNRRKGRREQAFGILNIPGYAIGTFALPFIQGFLGPEGMLTTSLFDIGNAFICLGGAYGVAAMVQDGQGLNLKRVMLALVTSVPFLAHILALDMNLIGVDFPAPVVDCVRIAANANVFLAMLMIGVGFKTDMDFTQIGKIVRILSVRYGLAAVFALAFYFLLPFSPEIHRTLVILAFAPIGSAVPGFTAELEGDVGLSCTLNSLSIVISILIIVVLLMVML